MRGHSTLASTINALHWHKSTVLWKSWHRIKKITISNQAHISVADKIEFAVCALTFFDESFQCLRQWIILTLRSICQNQSERSSPYKIYSNIQSKIKNIEIFALLQHCLAIYRIINLKITSKAHILLLYISTQLMLYIISFINKRKTHLWVPLNYGLDGWFVNFWPLSPDSSHQLLLFLTIRPLWYTIIRIRTVKKSSVGRVWETFKRGD